MKSLAAASLICPALAEICHALMFELLARRLQLGARD